MLGKLDGIRNLPDLLHASGKNQLHEEGEQIGVVDAGGFNAFGFLRDAVNEPLDRSSVDQPQRDQIFAEVAPLRHLALKRGVNVALGDQLGTDQQFA